MQFMLWHFIEAYQPVNFVLTAHLNGEFDPEMLRSALRKVAQAHPMSVARVENQNGRLFFVADQGTEYPLRLVARRTAHDWIRETEAEMGNRFGVDDTPVRFVCLQSGEVADLILTCHHAAADGLSAVYLMGDLIRFLADPKLEASCADVYMARSRVPDRIANSLAVRIPASIVRAAVKAATLYYRIRPSEIPSPATPKGAFCLEPWSLTREETTKLIGRARQEATSVQAAVCTAFLRAYAHAGIGRKGTKKAVSMPVNLRSRLTPPVGRDFGFFLSLMQLSVDCCPTLPFWQIARTLKTEMVRRLESPSLQRRMALTDRLPPELIDVVLRNMHRMPKSKHDVSITNLGALDLPERAGPLSLQSVYGPAVNGVEEEQVVGVSTAAGVMTFSLVFRDSFMERQVAVRIGETALRELRDAC